MTELQEQGEERLRPGTILSERYELLDRIGSGASAITWRARDRRLERVVAIKALRRTYALDPTFAQRFDREARTAASISHRNVVDVYDVDRDDEILYLVMQFIQGEDLKQLIQRDGPLGAERSREIALQVLAGLQAIHDAGIIHRDIKPQNVLIGQDGTVRVTDFGVAQVAMDVSLTTLGTTVGTAAYMAPEQAKGEDLSQATDLYAVGVMLYEMLTGTLPFSGPTHMALMLAHIQQDPVMPSRVNPELRIPGSFDGVVLQAMAKAPRDRFRTAQAMGRALAGASLVSESGTRTVQAAAVDQTRQSPAAARSQRSGAWPTPTPPPATGLAWARQSSSQRAATADRAGGGIGIVLWGFLFLIVLMLGAIGVYAFSEFITDDEPNSPTPLPTQNVEPTATIPSEEDDDGGQVIVPEDQDEADEEPPDEPEPTDEPTATDEPTETSEPTDEPSEPEQATIEEIQEDTQPTIGPETLETPPD